MSEWSDRRGREAEMAFDQTCKEHRGRYPSYLEGIIWVNRGRELELEADFYALIVDGSRIPIDIKASYPTLNFFLKKLKKRGRSRPNVIYIAFPIWRESQDVWDEFLLKLQGKHQELLATRVAAE